MTASSNRLFVLNIGNPSRLLSISADGGDLRTVCPDLGVAPDGIAVDRTNRHIFWTSMGTSHDGEDFFANDGSIERTDLDGGNRTTIIAKGGTCTPKQIQCDAAEGYIYWCDREGMRVMRARLDGTDPTILVQTGSTGEDRQDRRRHCVGVAIDHVNRALYWTQKGRPNGNEGRILRAELDLPHDVDPGNRPDVDVLFDDLPEPIDLEWDAETRHLYWTDRGDPPAGNTLNRSAIAGSEAGAPEVLVSGLHEAIGLTLDKTRRRAFVADLGGAIHVVDLEAPGRSRTIFCGHGPITGIAYLEA